MGAAGIRRCIVALIVGHIRVVDVNVAMFVVLVLVMVVVVVVFVVLHGGDRVEETATDTGAGYCGCCRVELVVALSPWWTPTAATTSILL